MKATANGLAQQITFDSVRAAAAGCELDILENVAGIDRALLDGRGHPCPKCGEGHDRFSLLDRELGAVICRKCFCKKNGDYFAAIAWMRGVELAESLRLVAEYLDVGVNGATPKTKTPAVAVFDTVDAAIKSWTHNLGPVAGRWDYHDADGELVAIALRFNQLDGTKEFRPVSRIGSGWVKKAPIEPRLLYRLPELLALPMGSRVYVCEGEQATDAVRSLGLVATTSYGGSQAAKKTDWTPLAGKDVVILPDHDEAGRKYAQDVVELLAELNPRPTIRIVELPDIPDGGDAVEYIESRDALTFDELRENFEYMANAATPIAVAQERLKSFGFGNSLDSLDSLDSLYALGDWPEPIPLGTDRRAEFPIEAIPRQVQEYLSQLSEFCQTPFDLAAGMWLAATGVALQKKFVVEPSRGWIEPVNLYVLAGMDPANRKSAVVAAIARPIRLFEETQAELLGPTIRAARSAHEIRTKQRQRLVDEAAKTPMGSDRDAKLHEVQQLDEEIAANPVPAEPRLLADDITPEHLATRMAQNNGRLGVLTAEGDLFDIMSGRYSSKGQANLGIFLRAHCGDEVRVDRGNRPNEFMKSPALSLGFCVQPEVQRGLMQQKLFRGRGLLGRFLYQLPESLLGRRKTSPAEVNPLTEAGYLAVMRTLLDLPVRQNDNGEFIPEVLSLDREADHQFRAFRDEIEVSLGEFGTFATIKDWAGKLPGAVARIAGLMHVVECIERQPIVTVISGGTMQNAIRLGHYFASHATAAFQIMGRDSVALAEHILHTIQRHDMRVFSKSDVHQKSGGELMHPTNWTIR